MSSVSFDRAAGYYDATRGLPADIATQVTEVLVGELAGRGRCLEVGVGTGRIARPVADRGVPLVGADTAAAMLDRLVRSTDGRMPFPLVRADAAHLPFRDASFGAVLFSHVLHLVSEWETVVDEAMRVVVPAGCLLVDFGGWTLAPWSARAEAILREHGIERVRPGVSAAEPVAAHLRGRATRRPLTPIRMRVPRSLAQDLTDWQAQIHAWTWSYPPEQMAGACDAVRAWATADGRSLDEVVQLDRVIQWWAFDLLGQSSDSARRG